MQPSNNSMEKIDWQYNDKKYLLELIKAFMSGYFERYLIIIGNKSTSSKYKMNKNVISCSRTIGVALSTGFNSEEKRMDRIS